MSFSFTVRGATKALTLAAVAAEMSKVVEVQPAHGRDEPAVNATAEAYVGLLPENADRDVVVSVNGWLQYTGPADAPEILSANLTVNTHYADRE
jgi:formaldehyde-activating enzyme involved in methanogenesis